MPSFPAKRGTLANMEFMLGRRRKENAEELNPQKQAFVDMSRQLLAMGFSHRKVLQVSRGVWTMQPNNRRIQMRRKIGVLHSCLSPIFAHSRTIGGQKSALFARPV
ncbi:hypothetical protein TWF694_006579 [Orbilia ellipsospora]|uniref:Uncharacterized protein n=1 Tax=Orbilia ellipsospora TaxID=2528407 RepID=A0AAV9XLX0_9PEZI